MTSIKYTFFSWFNLIKVITCPPDPKYTRVYLVICTWEIKILGCVCEREFPQIDFGPYFQLFTVLPIFGYFSISNSILTCQSHISKVASWFPHSPLTRTQGHISSVD